MYIYIKYIYNAVIAKICIMRNNKNQIKILSYIKLLNVKLFLAVTN